MNYEELLDEAYENVKEQEHCERFEILPVEGHHEGTRTIISNFGVVVGCLRRRPEHLAKFLFKELATSGEIAGDRLVLTSRVSSKSANGKIGKYVKKFVMCSHCNKPDTELIEEDGEMFIRCLACGHKGRVV